MTHVHKYYYDALGRRIAKTVDVNGASPNTTLYLHDAWRVIEERCAAAGTFDQILSATVSIPTSASAQYAYGRYIDEPLVMWRDLNGDGDFEDANEVLYYHTDDQFSVIALTDASGQIIERYDYDDYGRPHFFDANGTEQSIIQSYYANPHLWTGRAYDSETGLYYYRTRYLDPGTGQFTTEDYIGIWGDFQNFGKGTTYCGNNPWSRIDPLGLMGGWGSGGYEYLIHPPNSPSIADEMRIEWDHWRYLDFSQFLETYTFWSNGVIHSLPFIGAGNYMDPSDPLANFSSDAGSGMMKIELLLGLMKGQASLATAAEGSQLACVANTALMTGEAAQGAYSIGSGLGYLVEGDYWEGVSDIIDGTLAIIPVARFLPQGIICFTEGTLVETADGYVAIETIAVGGRVITEPEKSGEEKPGDQVGSDPTSVVPSEWRCIRLAMANPDDAEDSISIVTLRPMTWITESGARPGKYVEFALDEIGVRGSALVQSIEPCPPIQAGKGNIVLSTMNHLSRNVLEIRFKDSDAVLEPTETHWLYSENRACWLAAGLLRVGECIKTAGGYAEIASIQSKIGIYQVFNLEVEGKNRYYASILKVVAHNACPKWLRKPSNQIRREYEKEYGKDWPWDPKMKRNQDVSHKIAGADGGSNDLTNIEPKPHADHVREHSQCGDFKRWGGRAKEEK